MKFRKDFGVTCTDLLKFCWYNVPASDTYPWTVAIVSTRLFFTSSLHWIWKDLNWCFATLSRASVGHSCSQFMVHPEIRPGNFKALDLNFSPSNIYCSRSQACLSIHLSHIWQAINPGVNFFDLLGIPLAIGHFLKEIFFSLVDKRRRKAFSFHFPIF